MKTKTLINPEDYLDIDLSLVEGLPRYETTESLLAEFGETLARTITRLSDEELTNLENNYRRHKLTSGGEWALYEVIEERLIRNPDHENPKALINAILGESCYSAHGRMTYKKLWQMMTGEKRWRHHASKKFVQDALNRVTEFCVYNNLPVFSLLVGENAGKFVDDADALHIFDYCRSLHVKTGDNPFAFVSREIEICRRFMEKHASR